VVVEEGCDVRVRDEEGGEVVVGVVEVCVVRMDGLRVILLEPVDKPFLALQELGICRHRHVVEVVLEEVDGLPVHLPRVGQRPVELQGLGHVRA